MKKMKDPSKNKHNLSILKSAPAETPAPVSETSDKAEEHHGLVVFATDEDRIKFRNRFGIDAYPRKVVRAKFATTAVTYEQAAEVAAPAAEFLKKLINKTPDGPSGHCIYAGKGCLSSPNFMFVPFSEAVIDTWDPLQPKHAVVKKWIGEELATLLKVALPNGTDKSYYLFSDGRVAKLEHGATVFVSSDDAKMAMTEGKPIFLYKGRFFVDYLNRKVDGQLCYRCEEADIKVHGQKGAVRLTSKAAAEAELARFIKQDEADNEYQRRRAERENERVAANAVALDDLVSRARRPSKFSVGGASAGSRKTRDWGRDRSRRKQ